jgi:SAM-dependent methyltransferase
VIRRPSGYHFVTPVWGEAYTKLYVDVAIPAQLSPGNLPCFRNVPNCRYIVYTRPDDAALIRESAVFSKLNECIPVTFESIPAGVNGVHDLMTECYRCGIKAAESADCAILFMTPDIVLADGSLRTIKRLSEQGSDVIYAPSIRVMKSSAAAVLNGSFKSGEVIRVSSRDLMRIALDNLHPLAHSSWWEEGDGELVPATIYWRVGDEGILAHCFHLHPLLVYPQKKGAKFFGTVDDDFVLAACPDWSRDAVVNDSDDLLAIDLSDPWRFLETRFAKGSVRDTVRWAEQFANLRHQKLFTTPIRLHTGFSHPERWAEVEVRARRVVEEVAQLLDRPARQLLFEADLLSRRIVRSTKWLRLKLANPHLSDRDPNIGAGWRNGLLWLFERATRMRAAIVRLLRDLTAAIGRLAAKRYWSGVEGDLGAIIAPTPDIVLVSNSPGTIHIEAITRGDRGSSAGGRYGAIERANGVAFLEAGARLPDRSKDAVLLEVNAFRPEKISEYLAESRRVLREGGRLIIFLHRLSPPIRAMGRAPLTPAQLSEKMMPEFVVEQIKAQGGLGTHLRVKLQSLIREIINSRLDLRCAILVLSLPLLPISLAAGSVLIAATAVLDKFGGAPRYCTSNIISARRKGSHMVVVGDAERSLRVDDRQTAAAK